MTIKQLTDEAMRKALDEMLFWAVKMNDPNVVCVDREWKFGMPWQKSLSLPEDNRQETLKRNKRERKRQDEAQKEDHE